MVSLLRRQVVNLLRPQVVSFYQRRVVNLANFCSIKAVDLDSTLADAHVVLATRYLYTEWDFPRAEYHLKKAVELNPSIPSALYTWSWYLILNKRVDEAVEVMKRLVEVDPANETCQGYLAWIYFYFGSFEKAITESQKLLQLNPNSSLAYYLMGSSYAEMGRHNEAIEMHTKGLSLSPGYEQGLAIAYARAGQKEKAVEIANQMEKNKDQWWYTFGLAETYAAFGDWGKAINYLELSYRLHGDFVPWIKANPYFKPILNTPEFKEKVNRLKLPV